MADTIYLSKKNETLDLICWRFYGFQISTVEKVLENNPLLHYLDEILPIGTIIRLPHIIEVQNTDTTLRLWDYE